MTFSFAPACREQVSLLIMIAGASGSGKTFSALKIARGLAGGDDSRIAVIDTEAGRAKHYAIAPGEQPGPDKFGFLHGDLKPPFTPEAYRNAIQAADDGRFSVIMIDSNSHIWEGEGGVHDMHDAILDEQVEKARRAHSGNWEFDDAKTRERLSVGAWKTPKAEHKRFVQKILQTRAHLIMCFRADEKMRIEKVKDDRGRERTVIIQAKDLKPAERWSPICEKRFPYEMTISFVLSPENPGVPIPIKLQEQHRSALPVDKQITEDSGRALAEWSRGGSPVSPRTGKPAVEAAGPAERHPDAGPAAADEETESERLARLDRFLDWAAKKGTIALERAWLDPALTKEDRMALKTALERRHKPTAAAADTTVIGN